MKMSGKMCIYLRSRHASNKRTNNAMQKTETKLGSNVYTLFRYFGSILTILSAKLEILDLEINHSRIRKRTRIHIRFRIRMSV